MSSLHFFLWNDNINLEIKFSTCFPDIFSLLLPFQPSYHVKVISFMDYSLHVFSPLYKILASIGNVLLFLTLYLCALLSSKGKYGVYSRNVKLAYI